MVVIIVVLSLFVCSCKAQNNSTKENKIPESSFFSLEENAATIFVETGSLYDGYGEAATPLEASLRSGRIGFILSAWRLETSAGSKYSGIRFRTASIQSRDRDVYNSYAGMDDYQLTKSEAIQFAGLIEKLMNLEVGAYDDGIESHVLTLSFKTTRIRRLSSSYAIEVTNNRYYEINNFALAKLVKALNDSVIAHDKLIRAKQTVKF